MRFTNFFFLLYFFVFTNCKQQKLHISKVENTVLKVSDTLSVNAEIEAYIKPFRLHIKKDLDSVLAYTPNTYSKKVDNFNSAIGNFIADAVYSESNPVFKRITGKNIDMVLLNHGGIRAGINKGNISKQTAFELMPFENSVVVVALKGKQINNLIKYLSISKKAHPVSKLQLILDKDFNVSKAAIQGKVIKPNQTYYVATSDYLYNGGDNMTFFKPNAGFNYLNYKIRNVLIDKFNKIDTLKAVIDNRFIQIK